MLVEVIQQQHFAPYHIGNERDIGRLDHPRPMPALFGRDRALLS